VLFGVRASEGRGGYASVSVGASYHFRTSAPVLDSVSPSGPNRDRRGAMAFTFKLEHPDGTPADPEDEVLQRS
jgi:hypothetical protein